MTKEQIENSLRGFYSKGFFHIFVDGDVDIENFESMSQKDKGTLVHEFCHFIQNTGSLWGMYQSIALYEQILEIKKYIVEHEEINLPLTLTFPEGLQRKLNWIENGTGTVDYIANSRIDITKPFRAIIKERECNGKMVEYVECEVFIIGKGDVQFELGAHIIKESMAAMYQSIVDPSVEQNEFPYNLVELYCQCYYPELATDKRKLICACFTSLFTLQPGVTLIRILKDESIHPSNDGLELLADWVFNKNCVDGNGNTSLISDFYNHMVDGLLKYLRANLQAPLQCTEALINRTKPETKYMPLLSILYTHPDLPNDIVKEMMLYYGVPYIQTPLMCHLPFMKDSTNGTEVSLDILELIAQEAILKIFTSSSQYCCPLHYMCDGTEYDKEECFERPWDGNNCAFKIVSDFWGINKKSIKRNPTA